MSSWRTYFAAGLAITLLAPMSTDAQVPQVSPQDIAMLPNYCKYTQGFSSRVPGGNDADKIKHWYSSIGPTFLHMHHYCWGLIETNRAAFSARSRQERMHLLRSSIGNFDYVIQRAPPDFILLPEILTKKGENLIRLGQAPRGVVELQRAIELKADYWPPYAAMSDYFKRIGDFPKARDALEKGLSASPDAKALKDRLAKLDAAKSERKAAPQTKGKPAAPSAEEPAAPAPQPEQPAAPEPPAPR